MASTSLTAASRGPPGQRRPPQPAGDTRARRESPGFTRLGRRVKRPTIHAAA